MSSTHIIKLPGFVIRTCTVVSAIDEAGGIVVSTTDGVGHLLRPADDRQRNVWLEVIADALNEAPMAGARSEGEGEG